ncbi:methyltransferase domain-containing protein [Parathielavia appendiculata]|uniref:Methyltransferase domain-containing protein n=1 Tax=Parathielavia appendiculata TaxID=2587402 RepID=A0AAN6YZJ9_9PEZI|nr:methyltransferase domain-containing protein [Parathielavia appendiculata]
MAEEHTPPLAGESLRTDTLEPLWDDGTDLASDDESTATSMVSGGGGTDSAIDDLDGESTCTLPGDIPVVEEEGRKYHDPDKYPLPNDEQEQERLDMLHEQWRVSHDEKLLLCPQEVFQRVLDIGTGTGIWAIEFADEHPEAYVIGVDISPIQPNLVPPNCEFQIDDAELEWTWGQPFDFIHGRMLGGCFKDPINIFEQAFQHLQPGGFFEVKDILLTLKCDDGTLEGDSPLLTWARLLAGAADNMGRPIHLASRYRQMLVEVGFTHVDVVEQKWPTNGWAKNRKLRELGRWSQLTFGRELETISTALLMHGLGWDAKEVSILCALVRKEFQNPRVHAYFPVLTAFGMKPLGEA